MRYVKRFEHHQKRRIEMIKVWTNNIKMVIDNEMFGLDDMKVRLGYGQCPFDCKCRHETECLKKAEDKVYSEEEVIEDCEDELYKLITKEYLCGKIFPCNIEMKKIVKCPLCENGDYKKGEKFFLENRKMYSDFFKLIMVVKGKTLS